MPRFLADDADGPAVQARLVELRRVLAGAGFARTERLPLPGGPLDLLLDPLNLARGLRGRPNLMQPTAVPGLHRRLLARPRRPTQRRASPRRRLPPGPAAAVTLHRLLTAGETLPPEALETVLPTGLFGGLVDIGALSGTESGIRSEILVVPYRGRIYVSDASRHRNDPDFCYLGRASFATTDLVLADGAAGRLAPADGRPRRLLDLGCGPAVGALALSDLADEVVGSDLVPRALRFARLNAVLNDIGGADFVVSDLCDDVEGSFDLVVTHPPGTWTQESVDEDVVAAQGGADFGLELPQRMIRAALERTRPGGAVYAVMFAPVLRGASGKARPYVSEVVRRICAERPAEVTLHPMLEYFEYADAARYRAHRVTTMVRYLAVFRPADAVSVRNASLDRPRLLSSRLRTVPARLASAVRPTG